MFCFVGVTLSLIAGGYSEYSEDRSKLRMRRGTSVICSYSSEAQRVGLEAFVRKVKTTSYKMNPNNVVYDPDSTPESVRREFFPYNSHPSAIRRRTDAARALYQEANKLENTVSSNKLKPRESKAIAQVKHFLQSNFGAPYEENYYAGDWMLGPGSFCWHPICNMGYDLQAHFTYQGWGIQPKTEDDVNYVIDRLKLVRDSILQYIENMKYGIKVGFVRSAEDCQYGLYSLQRAYIKVSQLGPKGVLRESFTQQIVDPKWLAKLDKRAFDTWEKKHKVSVNTSINEALVAYLGKPLDKLLTYLAFNHSQYCAPSILSSGLASLPLSYIYKYGKNTKIRTTGKLPTGESLNGKRAYEMMLPYFTTIEMTPDEVYSLGERMLGQLYPKAVEIAKKITNKTCEDQAIEELKKHLEDRSMYFNDEKIPQNESNKDAFDKCTSMAKAKIYCPKRYQAMKAWFEYVNSLLGDLEPKTTHMFYFTGEHQSTPNCPVQLVSNFNPGTGSQSYRSSDSDCTKPAQYRLPFFMKDLGPKYSALSVAAHEARPGHHTQSQGFKELFYDKCEDVISWLNGISYYTAFTEGWALYAENPLIATETDAYADKPLQLYGMIKWQIWRALRLMIDSGLHYKGMKRREALKLFAEKAWDRTDKAEKDITRYQSNPGQATAYMIGQLRIWQVRNDTKARIEAHKKTFKEKDFHYQVLSQGSSPLTHLESHMRKFADCVIQPHSEGCEYIIRSLSDEIVMDEVAKKPHKPLRDQPYQEHFD